MLLNEAALAAICMGHSVTGMVIENLPMAVNQKKRRILVGWITIFNDSNYFVCYAR